MVKFLDSTTIATFTPSWTAASTNPAIGNGTITGHYQQLQRDLYWFCVVITMGTTTTYGTGNWIIGSLPFTVKSTTPAIQVVSAIVIDAGTASYPSIARLAAGGTTVTPIAAADTTGTRHITNLLPHTWANGDQLIIQGIVATD